MLSLLGTFQDLFGTKLDESGRNGTQPTKITKPKTKKQLKTQRKKLRQKMEYQEIEECGVRRNRLT